MKNKYNEGYEQGFNDTIKAFLEYVGNKDYALGDGKMTKRRLSKVKKIPKHKKGYKPKWG